jgi:hypothetical protein
MLNNMISPTDHVVMNHQNHTQTNGIWGHVRYKCVMELCNECYVRATQITFVFVT